MSIRKVGTAERPEQAPPAIEVEGGVSIKTAALGGGWNDEDEAGLAAENDS